MDSFQFNQILNKLTICKIEIGFGSFFKMYFDENIFLWVYLCDWAVKLDSDCSITSNDDLSYGDLAKNFKLLEGQNIRDIKFIDYSNVEILCDSSQIQLTANEIEYAADDELFMLYLEDEIWSLSVRDGFTLELR